MDNSNKGHAMLSWLLAWTLTVSQGVFADQGSKLEQFEEQATRPQPAKEPQQKAPPHDDDHKSEHQDELDEHLTQRTDAKPDPTFDLIEIMSLIVAGGGVQSWDRVAQPVVVAETDSAPSSDQNAITPRTLGEGLIPYLRVDGSYNKVSSHIDATDWRAEIGYGPFGFEYRDMRYTESDPNADLRLTEYHALYRMSAGDHVEIDIGYGQLDIDGTARNTGGSWTLPILIHPSPHFEIEYRPSWANVNGNDIRNQELAIGAGGRFWAVRAGYHWLETQNARLSGPFIGLSLRL